MKKLLIPILASLLLAGCDGTPGVRIIDANNPSGSTPVVELKYKVSDKVLLRLGGIEGIVTKIGGWNDDCYYVRMVIMNKQGRPTFIEVLLQEFEIEKKID